MTLGAAVANCAATQRRTTPAPRPTQRARVTLFFDGTMNNRTNTRLGRLGRIPTAVSGSHRASYANNESNVARMEPGLTLNGAPYDRHFRSYIEGIGTLNSGEDATKYGGGLGYGETGIVAKVDKGLDFALRQLRTMPTAKDFEYIHIDAYGFSRGAAAARHFVHKALYDEDRGIAQALRRAGYIVRDVTVRFVGLYDTVASYGLAHYNDTSELSLDAISAAAQVIQLAAAEEHRENFRLTNIASASGRNSCNIYLPGVHSDIGGGYNANAREELTLWSGTGSALSPTLNTGSAAEVSWLVDQGWFRRSELTISSRPAGRYAIEERIRGVRTVRSFEYSYIPLKILADYSAEQDLNFTNLPRSSDSFLAGFERRVRGYADRKRATRRSGGTPSRPTDWFHVADPDLSIARHDYFHFSAYLDGIGMDPERSGPGGRRQRIIQRG